MAYGDFNDLAKRTTSIKNENILNKELAEELYKEVIRKFKKKKVHSPFIDNIWSSDLAVLFYYV